MSHIRRLQKKRQAKLRKQATDYELSKEAVDGLLTDAPIRKPVTKSNTTTSYLDKEDTGPHNTKAVTKAVTETSRLEIPKPEFTQPTLFVELQGSYIVRLLNLLVFNQKAIQNGRQLVAFWFESPECKDPPSNLEELGVSYTDIRNKRVPLNFWELDLYQNSLEANYDTPNHIFVRTSRALELDDKTRDLLKDLIESNSKEEESTPHEVSIGLWLDESLNNSENEKFNEYLSCINNVINNCKSSDFELLLITSRPNNNKLKRLYQNVTCLNGKNLFYQLYRLAHCSYIISSDDSKLQCLDLIKDSFGITEPIVSVEPTHKTDYIHKNLLDKPIRSGHSVVTACMNRVEYLMTVLPSWLELTELDEIVIIDWSSDDSVKDRLEENDLVDERIKVYRVNDEAYWVATRAFNVAVLAATYDNVYKLNCEDVVVNPDLLVDYEPSNKKFFISLPSSITTISEAQYAGKLFCKRKNFLECGGYNENITFYGWYDNDINKRLYNTSKAKFTDIGIDNFDFIQHSDATRMEKCMVKYPRPIAIKVNKYLSSNVFPKWDSECKISEYKQLDKNTFTLDQSYNVKYYFLNPSMLEMVHRALKYVPQTVEGQLE